MKTRIGELEYGLQQTVAQAHNELRKQDAGFRAAYQRYVEEAHDAAQVECAKAVAAERRRNQSIIQDLHGKMLHAVKTEDVMQQKLLAQSHSHHHELTEQSMYFEQTAQAAVLLQEKHTEQLLAQATDASDIQAECIYQEAEAALTELQQEARVAERLHEFQVEQLLEQNKNAYDQGYHRLYQEANQALAEERSKVQRAEAEAQVYKDTNATCIQSQKKDLLDLQLQMQRDVDGLKRLALEEQEKFQADLRLANTRQQIAQKENDDLKGFIERASQDTAKHMKDSNAKVQQAMSYADQQKALDRKSVV